MNNKNSITITALSNSDYEAWTTLWQNYLSFYETSLPLGVTDATWKNIVDDNSAIYGFGAWQKGSLRGITHVVTLIRGILLSVAIWRTCTLISRYVVKAWAAA